MSERTFPVLGNPRCPVPVPWNLIARCAEQCKENHDQTPERLAERGGLCAQEMVAVIEGLGLREVLRMPDEEAVARLVAHVEAFNGIAEMRTALLALGEARANEAEAYGLHGTGSRTRAALDVVTGLADRLHAARKAGG